MTTWSPTTAFENQWTRSLLFILLAAFLVKAVVLFVALPAQSDVLSPIYGVGFADDYDRLANNIAQGNGYRIEPSMSATMVREPGYPLFLAGVFKLGGYRIEAARLANLLLAVGIAVMMIRLTRWVTDDAVTPVIATLLFLFHPGTLISEARGGVEMAFIFAVMSFMLTLHDALKKGNLWRYFVAGAALGLAVLVRSTPLLFPMFLLVYFLFIGDSTSERLRLALNVLVLVLGLAVVMSPWVIRNYALVHEFVPTATVQGIAAQEGQYICKRLSFDRGFQQLQSEAADERNKVASGFGVPFKGGYYQYFYTTKDEVAFNKRLLQNVAAEYLEDPMLLAQCVAKNLFNFWFLGKTWQVTWMNALVQLPLLVFALGGVYVLWKRGRLQAMGIMLTFVIYVIAVHVPIIAHTRHSIPVVPFLAILASVSLVSIWRGYRTKISKVTRLSP
jgi:4-amino-4-deoxy-L-arabinose transferase-like glycosyltransferase